MEDELWPALYRLFLEEHNRRYPRGQKRVRYSDAVILAVAAWAVLHDRPACWACRAKNWRGLPGGCPWAALPSPGRLSVRLKTLSVQQLLEQVFWRLLCLRPLSMVRRVDSKPLPVGGFSKDRDAKRGYATGGLAKGYKFFGCWGASVVPEQLLLGPLNQSDPAGAMALVRGLSRGPLPGGYLLADATHDTNPLHALAREHGFQLVAPRKQPGTGLGHGAHDPARLRAIEMLEGPSGFGRALYAGRGAVERDLAHLCGFGGGLQPLPSFVRRPRRVAFWVVTKLIINGIRLCQLHGLTP